MAKTARKDCFIMVSVCSKGAPKLVGFQQNNLKLTTVTTAVTEDGAPQWASTLFSLQIMHRPGLLTFHLEVIVCFPSLAQETPRRMQTNEMKSHHLHKVASRFILCITRSHKGQTDWCFNYNPMEQHGNFANRPDRQLSVNYSCCSCAADS